MSIQDTIQDRIDLLEQNAGPVDDYEYQRAQGGIDALQWVLDELLPDAEET